MPESSSRAAPAADVPKPPHRLARVLMIALVAASALAPLAWYAEQPFFQILPQWPAVTDFAGRVFLSPRERDASLAFQALQRALTGDGLTSGASSSDGQRRWVVGLQGKIFATLDGGRTWRAQASGTSTWLSSVAFSSDGRRGWAVGGAGSILATVDGGRTWRAQTSGTSTWLSSVAFSSDGQRGLAVGNHGAIVATVDGGRTWRAQTSETSSALFGVAVSSDGQRGWVVGTGGVIVATADGGKTWRAHTSGTSSALFGVAFSSDGQRGLAVGAEGAIVATVDGGKTWELSDVYARGPAPWFYFATMVVLCLSGFGLYRASNQPSPSKDSIEDRADSDEPIAFPQDDRLDSAELAAGLARFLRNEATRPPLVIAVNAPWGHGKSSVMKLLRHELDRAGVRSVWFNAWHHQQESLLIAPLLEGIQKQALPPWLSLFGLRFRARLLWLRVKKRPARALVVGLFFTAGLTHLWPALATVGGGVFAFVVDPTSALTQLADHWDHWMQRDLLQTLFEKGAGAFLSGVVGAALSGPEHLLTLLAVATLAGAVLVTALWGLRAFPEKPAVLLASLSDKFKLSEAQAVTTFRSCFQLHFGEVCEALEPRSMTIFVDDLDRCAPDKCAEVLEVVNYLASSGRCFVVLGLAREVIEAQLVQQYEKTAAAFTRVRLVDAAPVAEQDANSDRAQVTYVRNYLRKLINLEIRLQPLGAAGVLALVGQPQSEGALASGIAERSRWKTLSGRLLTAQERWGPGIWRASWWTLAAATLCVVAIQIVLSLSEASDKLRDKRQLDAEARAAMLHELDEKESEAAGASQEFGNVAPEPAKYAATRATIGKQLVRLRSSLKSAEAALALRNFGVFDKARADALKAHDAVMSAIAASEPSPGLAADAGVADAEPRPPPDPRPKSAGPVVVQHHAAPSSWPWTLPFAALALLVGFAVYRLALDDFVITDTPQFLQAVSMWRHALVEDRDLASPRELKRFVNKARYFAMRLRPPHPVTTWLRRLLLGPARVDAKTSIEEPAIVALTALHHMGPTFVHRAMQGAGIDLNDEDADPHWDAAKAALIGHESRFDSISRETYLQFLAAVGEFAPEADERGSATRRAAESVVVGIARSP